MKTTIEVTAEDIQNGERFDSCNCPVAIAMSRAIGSPIEVIECNGRRQAASWAYCNMRPAHQLPKSAGAFANDFDAGKPVQPFTFEIDL